VKITTPVNTACKTQGEMVQPLRTSGTGERTTFENDTTTLTHLLTGNKFSMRKTTVFTYPVLLPDGTTQPDYSQND